MADTPHGGWRDIESAPCTVCGCGAIMMGGVWGVFPHDHRNDSTGLDDGPHLPGQAPRKKPAPKPPEGTNMARARAWATRRRQPLPAPPETENG